MLGWPEKPPQGKLVDVPEPKKSDYVSDKIKSDNPVKSYNEYEKKKEKTDNKSNLFEILNLKLFQDEVWIPKLQYLFQLFYEIH